jgi:predicted ATP-binding protein involved in virulence
VEKDVARWLEETIFAYYEIFIASYTMRIETLYLKNFRNVEEQSYPLNPHFTVLIGINGRGKSTWLHALRVACGAYFLGIPDASKRHIISDEIRQTSKGFLIQHTPVIVEAKGILDNSEGISWRRQVPEGKNFTTSTHADVGEVRNIGKEKYDKMRSGSDDLDLPVIAFFGTSRVHGGGRVRDNQTTRTGRQIFKEGYHSWLEMRSSVYRYDAWLKTYDILVEEGKEYPQSKPIFFDTLKTANPYIKQVAFVGTELWLKVEMDDYTSDYLPIHLHSDGIISYTEMVAELAYRCVVLNGNKREKAISDTKGVVMIDELDLHLHPSWQRHVVSDLKQAFPNIQFVATTHSPFIVQSLLKSELINLDLENANEGLETDPLNYGIEDVAEIEMLVENVPRSEAFKERVEVAGLYFSLIKQGKTSDSDAEVAQLRQKMNEMEERFSDDPVFVASLRIERNAYDL